jgi:hypothetical protein
MFCGHNAEVWGLAHEGLILWLESPYIGQIRFRVKTNVVLFFDFVNKHMFLFYFFKWNTKTSSLGNWEVLESTKFSFQVFEKKSK